MRSRSEVELNSTSLEHNLKSNKQTTPITIAPSSLPMKVRISRPYYSMETRRRED